MQTNGFGNSSYNDQAWASARAAVDPPFVVSGPDAWRPVVATTADRTIRITTTGVGVAYGVRAAFVAGEAAPTIALDPNTGTTNRLDLLIARFDWAARSITFRSVNANAVVSTSTLLDTGITRVPGVRYDAVIGAVVVRPNVGPLSGPDLVDLRLWGGHAGPMITNAAEQYRTYLDAVDGTQVLFTPTGRTFRKAAGVWHVGVLGALLGTYDAPWTNPAGAWGTPIVDMTSFTIPDPGQPFRPQVYLQGEFGSTQLGTRYDFRVHVAGAPNTLQGMRLWTKICLGGHMESVQFHSGMGPVGPPITGQQTYRLVANRVFGSALGAVTNTERLFRVHYWAA